MTNLYIAEIQKRLIEAEIELASTKQQLSDARAILKEVSLTHDVGCSFVAYCERRKCDCNQREANEFFERYPPQPEADKEGV